MKLLSIALEQEYNRDNKPEDHVIVYTGVGKINATFAITKAIIQTGATEVINFGTAGSVNGKHTGLVEVDTILQRDMVAVDTMKKAGVTSAQVPEHVTNALTRDYSDLMKHDKFKGKK